MKLGDQVPQYIIIAPRPKNDLILFFSAIIIAPMLKNIREICISIKFKSTEAS